MPWSMKRSAPGRPMRRAMAKQWTVRVVTWISRTVAVADRPAGVVESEEAAVGIDAFGFEEGERAGPPGRSASGGDRGASSTSRP